MAVVRSVGADGRDAVVCTQGEVIPDLVEPMAAADGFLLEEPVRARKGSIWALSIDLNDQLVATDSIPEPRPAVGATNGSQAAS